MIYIKIEIPKSTNSCFVAMPFNPLFKSEYENIIQPAIVELGLECVRGDEIYSQQRIMDDIWLSIRSCRLVVAELTSRNPNVLYEIGLAHALGKPVIILTRNSEDVPFDLKDLRYLFYDTNDPYWGEALKKGLQNLISKVIENPDIGSYLQGIYKADNSEFPDIPKNVKTTKPTPPKYNIAGTWKGHFFDRTGLAKHDVILTLSQIGNKLSGKAIISHTYGGPLTVVQEIFNGTLNDDKANLIGVNYSYLERGEINNYHLDTFEIIIQDEKKMIGRHLDENGAINNDIIFEKFE